MNRFNSEQYSIHRLLDEVDRLYELFKSLPPGILNAKQTKIIRDCYFNKNVMSYAKLCAFVGYLSFVELYSSASEQSLVFFNDLDK